MAKKDKTKKGKAPDENRADGVAKTRDKMPGKVFEKELRKLQTELCIMQEWI